MPGENFSPQNGKIILNDGSIVNIADLFISLMNGESNIVTEAMELTIYQKRHREIHKGNFYTFAKIITVPDEDIYIFSIETQSKYLHLFPPIVKTSGPNVELYIYEGSTYTAGDNETPINNNFVSPNTSTIILKSDVTFGANGTKKYTDFAPGATGLGGRVSGSSTSEVQELIFKPNTKHTVIIDNKDTNSDKMLAFYQWYETLEND